MKRDECTVMDRISVLENKRLYTPSMVRLYRQRQRLRGPASTGQVGTKAMVREVGGIRR